MEAVRETGRCCANGFKMEDGARKPRNAGSFQKLEEGKRMDAPWSLQKERSPAVIDSTSRTIRG